MTVTDELPDVMEGVTFDYETKTYRASFDSKTTNLSTAVIRMMSTVMNKGPLDLPPLGATIDLDSFEQILTSPSNGDSGNSRKIEFTYANHTVTVKSCGLIKVQPHDTVDNILDE